MSIAKILFALFVCLTVQMASDFAYAESEFKDEEYNKFVTEVFKKATKHDPNMYKELRELYRHTSFYDPNFPPSEVKEALAKRKDNMTESEINDFVKSISYVSEKYAGDLYTHMTISNYYWALGQKDISNRYANIANNLAAVVYHSGDGLSAKTAFKAINKTEQQFIITYFLKKKYDKKRLENIEGKMFDVYETYDINNKSAPKEGTQDVYFDISGYFGQGVVLRELEKNMEAQKSTPITDKNVSVPQ